MTRAARRRDAPLVRRSCKSRPHARAPGADETRIRPSLDYTTRNAPDTVSTLGGRHTLPAAHGSSGDLSWRVAGIEDRAAPG